MATTPDKPGTRALASLDELLASVEALATPAPVPACDLCGSPELCGRCDSQRSE